MQECAAGLLSIDRGERLAFEAPPLIRESPVDEDDLSTITEALRISRTDVVDARWADNGPGWVVVLLDDARAVLSLEPDLGRLGDLEVGVAGLWRDRGSDADVEVRAFVPGDAIGEDPVTGSLNASLGQWLAGTVLPERYVAAQGTAIGRRGRVHVRREGSTVWVGGDTRTTVRGEVSLPD